MAADLDYRLRLTSDGTSGGCSTTGSMAPQTIIPSFPRSEAVAIAGRLHQEANTFRSQEVDWVWSNFVNYTKVDEVHRGWQDQRSNWRLDRHNVDSHASLYVCIWAVPAKGYCPRAAAYRDLPSSSPIFNTPSPRPR